MRLFIVIVLGFLVIAGFSLVVSRFWIRADGPGDTLSISYIPDSNRKKPLVVDVSFYRTGQDNLVTTVKRIQGRNGKISVSLRSVSAGTYDIVLTPQYHLGRSFAGVTIDKQRAKSLTLTDKFLFGDIGKTQDGVINNSDLATVLDAWNGKSTIADYNEDKKINGIDAGPILENWNERSESPSGPEEEEEEENSNTRDQGPEIDEGQ